MGLFWLLMEWGGVVLALSAAYLMSTNTGKEKLAWCIFLAADMTHAIYYSHTGQTGLVYNQAIGFIIALLGLVVVCNRENKLIQVLIGKIMNVLIFLFAAIGIFFGIKWAMLPTFANLEWTAAFISLMGTALMASSNKFARFGFFGWLFCDLSMLYVAVVKSQFGIILLRIIYTLIDFNGIIKRFGVSFDFIKLKKKQNKKVINEIVASY